MYGSSVGSLLTSKLPRVPIVIYSYILMLSPNLYVYIYRQMRRGFFSTWVVAFGWDASGKHE